MPLVCPECSETEMPAPGLVCDLCFAEILIDEIDRRASLDLAAQIDRTLAAALRLDASLRELPAGEPTQQEGES